MSIERNITKAEIDKLGFITITGAVNLDDVDDVLEYANLAAFPVTGETGTIYIALDTNKIYRWTGSVYVEISSGVSDTNALLSATNEIRVKQNPGTGEFSSIDAALASITTNTSTNRFVIRVFPGEYIEPELDFAAKPYVSLVGSSITSVVIKPAAATHHILRLGEYNEISFVSLEGAGVGFAGIYCSDSGVFSQAHKVSISNCDTCILVENTTVDTEVYLEYVDFDGAFCYGLKVVNNGAGTLFVNAENQYSFNDDVLGGLISTYHVEGANAVLEMLAGGNENAVNSGVGLTVHSGATANVSSMYFTNYTKGFYMPNTGATPLLNIVSCFLDQNLESIDIAHVLGTGSFQGTTKISPVFNIVSTATFGISYLERALGNKKTIEFDGLLFNLVSGITPTTTAAATVILTATGTRFARLRGGNANDDGFSAMFQIPSDYQSSGKIKLVYTSQTGTPGNFKLHFILSKKAVGDDFVTTTETGLSLIEASTTQYQKEITAELTPATAFAIGDNITIRVYRLGADVDDLFTGEVYIANLLFEYESNK